jgi:hypothetical protein
MINLSVNAINQRAPYKVEQTGDTSFMFETKHGTVYSVGFMQDVSFYSEGVYQFYLINLSSKTIGVDKKISETIRVVIEEFFSHKEVVMLYICDTADTRQEYRDRLFKIWFNTYEKNDLYALYSEGLTIDNVHYFSGILLRKDHPSHINILSAFHNFIAEHTQE